LTPDAVERASAVTSATRLIASAPMRASPEARLTPSVMEATAEFCCSTVAATIVAIADILRTMVLTCSIACDALSASDWIEPISSAISAVAFAF
jgi:hypothetical protein